MAKKNIYKVLFVNQGKVYEIYAKQVNQSGMFGFIEVEGLCFGEKSGVLIDPAEERLKSEFAGVERTYIPMNSIIRVDEVEKRGVSKITTLSTKTDNVTPFPPSHLLSPSGSEQNS